MGLHLLPLLCDHFGLALWHFSMQKSAEMNQKLQCPISHFRQMQRKPILTFCYWYGGIPETWNFQHLLFKGFIFKRTLCQSNRKTLPYNQIPNVYIWYAQQTDLSNTTFFTPIPIPNISKEALTIPNTNTNFLKKP